MVPISIKEAGDLFFGRTAIATLVNKLGLTAINVHLRNMIDTLCGASFVLTLLSTIALAAVVVPEYADETTQEKITRKAGEAVASDLDTNILRGSGSMRLEVSMKGPSSRSNSRLLGRLGAGAAGRAVVPQRVSLVTSLIKRMMNGHERLDTGHNVV
ncbi:hypothetical protein C7212DRAFT_359764 [Tuber magnatum]|uniref:Uncharacterized protein n=1 Tax=Tuber magnatum TaxID=42249 RepID=A0A317SF23_9PEZI|nr:hypothetical protein C7212DRAFT_359764 [Tuber magnatum]